MRKHAGHCDHPKKTDKEIKISTDLTEEAELETVCHELIHAACWFFDEEFVHEFGHDIGKVLWRLGYRRTKE
jgi:hypothetical protein